MELEKKYRKYVKLPSTPKIPKLINIKKRNNFKLIISNNFIYKFN